ncbi:MAG: TonB-dependent siderophore receptor [Alphaproteobacteria bacterium]|nr:TonB-dependent siderophore receptor [Alphaproteobacteria bacterium]MBU0796245.1 TonB-dependent siderophore receptor [Alphaproteobacteria bacterium]MBU0885716.1 TonB-dependent siderophore receptor [Alphaproteobacteria bacterium]MBU1813130.1 TonB-dependent siderophore receptor [Alphaproteobacteria bacterium]MBU2092207.1 TonB-dependent siderophore receptor [Alphaproteobacteria bacterium]
MGEVTSACRARRRRMLSGLLMATTVLAAGWGGDVARAQDRAATGPVQLDPVTVEGKAVNPKATVGAPPPVYAGGQVSRGARLGVLGNFDMMDTPFTGTSYTEETIRNQQAETLAGVLANDPAVRSTYGYAIFGELFVIRGFPVTNEDITIDGLHGTAPRQVASTEMYERVEVLRGASAFLNGVSPGGGGIGGTINLVPKRAGDEPLTRFTGSLAQDSRIGGHLDVGRRFGPDGELGVRANLVSREGETAIDNEERSVLLGSLGLDYRGDRARASLDLGYQRQRVDQGRGVVFVTGPIVPEAPDASTNYAQPWTYSELRDSFAQFRGEYDVSDKVMAYTAFGMRDMHENGDYSSLTVDGTGAGTAGRLGVPRRDRTYTGQAGVRSEIEIGPVLHRFDVGVSALRTENRNSFDFAASQPANIYNPVTFSRPDAFLVSGSFENPPKVSQSELRSFYVSDTAGFWNDQVLLTLGLRQQYLHVEGFDRATDTRTENYDESALTPVVGIVYKPIPEVALYANRIEGLAQGPTAPGSAINVGEIFAPYKSVQYEIGGKVDLGGIGASLALFETTQPSGVTDPDTLVFSVSGEQRHRGIEFMLFGEPMKGVRLLGGVTVTDAALKGTAGGTNDGNDAVGVPAYQANFGAEWDPWFMPELTLTGRVLHTAAQYLDQANTQRVPSWSRLDVGARYATEIDNRPVVFRFNIENLTDEAYWASAHGGYLTLGAPLTAKLSVGVDF